MESISEMTSNMDLSKKSSKEMRLVLKEHNKIRAIVIPEPQDCIIDHDHAFSLSMGIGLFGSAATGLTLFCLAFRM